MDMNAQPTSAVQHCFLTPQVEHEQVKQSLQNTIFVCPILEHDLPPRNHLITLLMARYGGLPSNWPLTQYKEGFLFKSPDWLLPNEPILDSEFWEVFYGISMWQWQSITPAPHGQSPTRRTIIIEDFPVDLWHWEYFKQATNSMGTLVEIAPECIDGRVKSYVRLAIDCYDVAQVPHLLYIWYSGVKTRCHVYLEGRQPPNGFFQWPQPPDEGDDDDGEGGNGPNHPHFVQMEGPQLGGPRGFPQFTHLRARMLEYPNPAREGAPAAAESQTLKWSTKKGRGTGSRKTGDAVGQIRIMREGRVYNKQKVLHCMLPDKRQNVLQDAVVNQRREQKEPDETKNGRIFLEKNSNGDEIILNTLPLYPKSILGKPPSYSNQSLSCSKNTQQNTSISDLSTNPKTNLMDQLSKEDQALIEKFVGLSTEEDHTPSVTIPAQGTTSTNWSTCILAKVITDRIVHDGSFAAAMITAWGADPGTAFRAIKRNCYFVEFTNEQDMDRALMGGLWTYRGDAVATMQVLSHADINPELVGKVEIWVQLYNIPFNSLNEEGFQIIGRAVGTPVSASVEGFVNGHRFRKIKVMMEIAKPLPEKVRVTHPYLGEISAYCTYEKVSRACRFCGCLGHEMQGCFEYNRLSTILSRPGMKAQVDSAQLLKPKRGLWWINSAFIPREDVLNSDQTSPTGQTRNKRAFANTSQRNMTRALKAGNESGPQEEEVFLTENMDPLIKRPRPAGPDTPANHL